VLRSSTDEGSLEGQRPIRTQCGPGQVFEPPLFVHVTSVRQCVRGSAQRAQQRPSRTTGVVRVRCDTWPDTLKLGERRKQVHDADPGLIRPEQLTCAALLDKASPIGAEIVRKGQRSRRKELVHPRLSPGRPRTQQDVKAETSGQFVTVLPSTNDDEAVRVGQ